MRSANPRERLSESAEVVQRIRDACRIMGAVKVIGRHAAPFARDVLEAFPCLMIQGARQVGKSTFAQALAAERDAAHYSLDDEITRDAIAHDPEAFVAQHPGRAVVIDEIQRLPELILPIKAAIDRDRRPGRFILTGSSDLLRVRGTPDSLAGRAVTIELEGFSQGELIAKRDDFASALRAGIDPDRVSTTESRQSIISRIVSGGFPEAQYRTARMRNTWFDAYVERIVRRDALDVRAGVDNGRLLTTLKLLAANQSGELVVSRLAKDARIPERTMPGYVELLDILYLVTQVRPWTPNLTSRETGRRKSLIRDSGLAARLARLGGEQLSTAQGRNHLGGLLEGFVVSELLKQRTWSDTEFEVYHWRDRNGTEVDVVLEFDDGRVLGLEIKASTTRKGEHFKGLRALQEKLGSRFIGGVTLSLHPEGYQFSRGLIGLPVSALWEL